MSQVTVQWSASEELRREEFVATGKRPVRERKFHLNLTELTPEQRRPIIEHLGSNRSVWMDRIPVFDPTRKSDHYLYRYARLAIYYDVQPTVAEILVHLQAVQVEAEKARDYEAKAKAEEKAEKVRLLALYEEALPKVRALVEARDLEGLKQLPRGAEITGEAYTFRPSQNRNSLSATVAEACREISRERAKAEKVRWIEEHGSSHLKRASAGGYDCQRLYIIERAESEAPNFVVDFDDEAEWKTRSCPSVEGFDLLDKARKLELGKPEVVWLTAQAQAQPHEPGASEDEWEGYADPAVPCEAVVIRDYLGKYDLVQVV